jgi:hypothetical protein
MPCWCGLQATGAPYVRRPATPNGARFHRLAHMPCTSPHHSPKAQVTACCRRAGGNVWSRCVTRPVDEPAHLLLLLPSRQTGIRWRQTLLEVRQSAILPAQYADRIGFPTGCVVTARQGRARAPLRPLPIRPSVERNAMPASRPSGYSPQPLPRSLDNFLHTTYHTEGAALDAAEQTSRTSRPVDRRQAHPHLMLQREVPLPSDDPPVQQDQPAMQDSTPHLLCDRVWLSP